MTARSHRVNLGFMTGPEPVHVELDLDHGSGTIHGRITVGHHAGQPFHCWLELLGMLERASRRERGPSVDREHNHRPRPNAST